jgi:hypothetical protein
MHPCLRALTSSVRGIYNALTLTSSYKKRFPTPSPRSFAISELVQAQGCPVVRLGRVHVDWVVVHRVVFVSQFPLIGLPRW